MPKVSVIIPVYNVEKYLRQCLDSVINQTLQDIEIICINDGSTDNSLKILQEYAQKDNRITIINKENAGVSVARNIGIRSAKSPYIAFLDSDDWVDLDFYEKLYSTANTKDYDVVKGGRKILYQSGKKIKIDTQNKQIKKCRIYFCFAFHSTLFKKDFLQKHNLHFPESILTFEDPIFSLSVILKNPKIKIIDRPYYVCYRRAGSKSKTYSKEKLESFLFAMTTMLNLMNNSDSSKRDYEIMFYDIVNKRFINKIHNVYKVKSDEKKLILQKYVAMLSKNLKYKKLRDSNDTIEKVLTNYEKYKQQKLNFISRLFSIKNVQNKKTKVKHKVITILGIKLKIKIK